MEFFVRLLLILVKLISYIVYPLFVLLRPCARHSCGLPPIDNQLLTLTIEQLQQKLCKQQLTSHQIVTAYIERIKIVNDKLNAVVEECFALALAEANRVDALINSFSVSELNDLFQQYPLLGLPMTVKESCSLKNMSFTVGSLRRANVRAETDGAVVANLRAAGAIPLLVSTNPEYCYSIETFTYTNGRTLNPYDSGRTPGGSSGGEGALNGAGATLFGVGSDIGGSIRIPSLFCGIFGHKPTAGVVSVSGHFPNSPDATLSNYLQLGPISRYAGNLRIVLKIMAGENAEKLTLDKQVQLKEIKVYYALGFDGINGLMHAPVSSDIKTAILRAIKHCKHLGLVVREVTFKSWHDSLEISLSGIARLSAMPFLMNDLETQHIVFATIKEFFKSLIGHSPYTTNSLIFELMRRMNAFMTKARLQHYRLAAEQLKQEFIQLLGTDGILIFPTMHLPAVHHNTSAVALWGIDYTLLFNILGLPVTHVPMGLNRNGLPIGFSIIAAPYQDHLCLSIACEFENAFGGWVPPVQHAFKTN